MSSRRMHLLPWAALRSDSKQLLWLKKNGKDQKKWSSTTSPQRMSNRNAGVYKINRGRVTETLSYIRLTEDE